MAVTDENLKDKAEELAEIVKDIEKMVSIFEIEE